MVTFDKGITVTYKCGHTLPLPDDFIERTGVKDIQSFPKVASCPICLKRQEWWHKSPRPELSEQDIKKYKASWDWGGKREGAGRPSNPEPMSRHNVYTYDADWEKLIAIDPSPSQAIHKLLNPD